MKRIMLIVLPVFLMLTFGCNTTDYNSADDIPENNDNYNSSNLNDSSIEKKSYRIKRKIVHDGIFSEKDGTVDLITEYEYDDKGNIIKESTSDYEKIRMNEYLNIYMTTVEIGFFAIHIVMTFYPIMSFLNIIRIIKLLVK